MIQCVDGALCPTRRRIERNLPAESVAVNDGSTGMIERAYRARSAAAFQRGCDVLTRSRISLPFDSLFPYRAFRQRAATGLRLLVTVSLSATCWFGLLTLGARAGQHVHPLPPEIATESPVSDESLDPETLRREVDMLVLQLDAGQFSQRNEATRQLVAMGPQSVPLLVAALGNVSREARFRVAGILRSNFSFDDIAPCLVDAIDKKYGSEVRLILRDRALLQVSEAAEMENSRRLFAFWNTDIETLQRRVMFDLLDARLPEQAGAVVAPLVGLRDKAEHFDQVLMRLSDLSLPFDHRHSPGFLMAETLAQGLLHEGREAIDFAHQYVASFETLSRYLEGEQMSRGAIRKEIADRANMSDGAASFLVDALNDEGAPVRAMADLGISCEMLQNEFFRGLALPDTKSCFRCVGKVHIADMLLESLEKWPAAPRDGAIGGVIDCVVVTVSTGDKPKALALLDALDGCADLAAHQLDVRTGLGERMSKRLCLAAQVAPNSREYHPVRAINDRVLKLIDLGIQPDQDIFPHDFVNHYLNGDATFVDDNARTALSRYVRIIEQLNDSQQSRDQPGVQRFLSVMVTSLCDQRELLETGAGEVARLLERKTPPDQPMDAISLDMALDSWVKALSPAWASAAE